ncbi:hypothetical protein NPIL_199061 [Nephila pilipes]|uniref:Uncharacterized protein n=1 Tax=Nephila pilipes TaxID=299642 RepID=A0A8X6TML0_NEPPI|nr:hypothetical protein NPIL_199061 [Nephila pilipes]
MAGGREEVDGRVPPKEMGRNCIFELHRKHFSPYHNGSFTPRIARNPRRFLRPPPPSPVSHHSLISELLERWVPSSSEKELLLFGCISLNQLTPFSPYPLGIYRLQC